MDMQTNNSSSRPTPPVDDLFEDFDFKPLSEGLGFHHGNKQKEAVKEAQRVVAERSTAARPAARPTHPFEQHRMAQPPVQETNREFVQNDLALFYQSKNEPQLMLDEVVEKRFEVATKPVRLSAFIIDCALVLGLTAFTVEAVSILTGMDFWMEIWALDSMMLGTITVLFSGYFLLYFTMLEKFQGKSLGKDLLGLSLETNKNPPLITVFARSLATLLGFLSLGLTNAVDLPGKLTNTKVVRA